MVKNGQGSCCSQTKTQAGPASVIADGLWIAFIVTTAFFIHLPLLLARASNLAGDELVVGLMAKHIFSGEFPIYYWGQSYMGAVTSYIVALFSLVGGLNGITLQMGVFFFYEAFLVVNYFLVKKVLGLRTAIFASLFLMLTPLMMAEFSMKSLGAYPEIFFLGALSLFFWIKVFADGNSKFLIPLGLTLGFALYLNSLFIMYLAAFGLMTFFWKKGFDDRAQYLNPVNLITLKNFNLPIWLKITFYAVSVIVAFYIAKQLFVFFHGGLDHKVLGLKFQEPAFQWKGVKKMLLLISGDVAVLALLVMGWRNMLGFVKRWLPLIAAFFIGYLPAFLYGILGGEGYRLLHKSGAVKADALGAKLEMVYGKIIPQTLWGGNAFVIGLFSAGILYFLWMQRSNIKNIFTFRSGVQDAGFFFVFLGAMVLVLGSASALVADRYLSPFYWVSAVCAGVLIAQISQWTRGLGVLILLPYLWININSLNAAVKDYGTRERDIPGLIQFLEEKGLKGGMTDYDSTFQYNFYGDERVIFIPRVGMMRRPEYREFVAKLDRKIFVCSIDSDVEKEFLAAYASQKPLEVHEFKNYRVYVFDQNLLLPDYK